MFALILPVFRRAAILLPVHLDIALLLRKCTTGRANSNVTFGPSAES